MIKSHLIDRVVTKLTNDLINVSADEFECFGIDKDKINTLVRELVRDFRTIISPVITHIMIDKKIKIRRDSRMIEFIIGFIVGGVVVTVINLVLLHWRR